MLLDMGSVLILLATFFGLFTTLFFLVTLLEHWGAHHSKPRKNRFPTVCVIVPCFNEVKTVGRTVESLLNLDYPKQKLQIFVVDDGSTDDTYEVASRYRKHGVTVLKKPNGGKHTALNLVLKRTKAEFVGALDADSTVAPDALKKIMGRFDRDTIMAVTPSMIIDTPKGILRRIQSTEFLIGILLRRVFADTGSQHVTPGPFTIYRKWFFDNHGTYRSAHLTEDIEVALRIQTHHYIIENATDAYVYTHGPATWRGLYKQRIRWYYGFISNVIDYKHLFSREHGNLGLFILPCSFLSIGFLGLLLIYTVVKGFITLAEQLYHYSLIGFDFWRLLEWNFDSFFINTGPLAVLGVISLLGSIFLILVAKRFAKEKHIVYSYILFALLYTWLFIFWWGAAIAHKVFKAKVVWGHKSIAGA